MSEITHTYTEPLQNSCEISTDAKGQPKVTVKAYDTMLSAAVRTAAEQYRRAQELLGS